MLLCLKSFIGSYYMFKGSFVALVTPMHTDGSVDFASLEKLVDFHIDAGTHGIVSVGTTGESATLSFSQHIDVVKETVRLVGGRIPVIAGSGANSTEEAIFLQNNLSIPGVDGFLSVVPYYNKPQQRGMVAHYKALAAATDLPIMLYNVPGRTVADMLTPAVVELAQIDNIVGLKDATGDLARLQEAQASVPADFLLFSGDDATGCQFMNLGGHGVISVTANIVPRQMAEMCAAAMRGEHAQATAIDQTIAALHSELFVEANPVMPKFALQQMGLLESDFVRLPLVTAEPSTKSLLKNTLVNLSLV